MTAKDILRSWRAVCGVLSHPSSWFALLNIAEAGDEGITLGQLTDRPGCTANPIGSNTLRRWEAAGLITTSTRGPKRKGQSTLVLHITEKGLLFLRLQSCEPKGAAQ